MDEHLKIYVATLDDEQKLALYYRAREKYPDLRVFESSINHLPVDSFQCNFTYVYNDTAYVNVTGYAQELGENPIMIKFNFSKTNPLRKHFLERIKDKYDAVEIDCEMVVIGVEVKKMH